MEINSPWANVLKEKYDVSGSEVLSRGWRGSGWWNELLKLEKEVPVSGLDGSHQDSMVHYCCSKEGGRWIEYLVLEGSM